MPTLSIEGNIGAGKSTLLAALAANAPTLERLTVVPEPVDKWTRCGILGLFYRDPRRWAYAFQSYAFFSRLKAQIEARRAALSATVAILERSVWSDRHVFGAQARADGLFTEPAEATMYDDWHAWLVDDAFADAARLDGIVYLRAPPDVCLARIAGRGRPEEADVPLAYLEALHARHEAWLSATPTPVLVLEHDMPQAEQLACIGAFIQGLNG
jgi:deoxyadenosine/deoxycytidine kinase